MSADLDLLFQSATTLAERVRSKELSPVELLDECLKRIDEVNPTLNAFVAMREDEARKEAKAMADAIARGEDPGPLAGLPLGVKDLEDVEGLPNTYGSLPWKDSIADQTTVEVQRLQAAGAIVLGKTNSPEFGYTALTKNLVYGVTRNPWNPEKTPGGSSGGSSSAIASGMVPLVTASDGGGSVRIPACFVGAYGLKPSYARIPHGPDSHVRWIDTSVKGPITRTVQDAARFMDATVGPHWCDPDSLPHPGLSYEETLGNLPKDIKIAWNPTFGYARCEPDVFAQQLNAVDAFRELGHQVDEIDDELPRVGRNWAMISDIEVLSHIHEVFAEHKDEFGRSYARGLQAAKDNISVELLGDIYKERKIMNDALQGMFERYDLVLTPQLPIEAFDAKGPFPREIDGQELEHTTDAVVFTFPYNFSGQPAASVRAGFGKNGLPVGLQIAANRHRDDLVLQASYAYEQIRPWADSWPREVAALAG